MTQYRRWFVVATNSQAEEKAAKSLRGVGYRVYIPKMRKTIIHHRTKKLLDRRFKLFNRYIFMSVDPANLPKVSPKDCDGVYEILGVKLDGRPCEIPRETIRRIMLAQWHGEFDDITEDAKTRKEMSKKRFGVGSEFRVRSNNPFTGFYGTVVKIKGRGVIKAMLEVFGKTVPIEFEPEDIEPIDKAA
jgi:transcription antitermination factor NusG